MKKRLLSVLKFCVGWPLTIVAFIFIGKIILSNSTAVIFSVKHANVLLLFFGVCCFLGYFFFRAAFWKKLLDQKGHLLSYKETAYTWGLAEIKRYIPGNIWSFISRTHRFAQKGIQQSVTLSATAIEAEFIVASSILISLLSLNFIVFGLLPQFPYKHFLVIIIIALSFISIAFFLANRYFFKNFQFQVLNFQFLPRFPLQTTLSLLLIQSSALFCFGLGTYFSIAAIIPLYLPYIFTFVGYFVFSLLVGYISLITPMGLGIREGVMTGGLAKFIPLSYAGFGAIFGRIVFIVSELLFLLIMYVWNKLHTKTKRLEHFVLKHWQEIILALLILIYVAYFTTVSFLRYDNFYTGRFDLGNMDQTVWNTIHGRIFQFTNPNGTATITRLAFHADFILVLLAPFYLLWQNPKMLLLIQTLSLASGAVFVFLISKKALHNKTFSLVFALAYLLYPGVNNANLYDFHGVTLATTFLLGAFYFLQTRKLLWMIVFVILAGLTKEEVWIVGILLGLYTIIHKETPAQKIPILQKGIGVLLALLSTAIFYFLVFHAIPNVRGGEHFALSYYSDFGMTPTSIIKNIIFSPQKTLAIISQSNRLYYLLKLFAPLGFLSLFSLPYLIFALPDLTINILSNNSQFHEIYFHYTSAIVPFLFIAAVYGVKRMHKISPKLSSLHTTYYLLLATIVSAYFFGPLPGAYSPNLDMITAPQPSAQVIEGFLLDIPRKFSVAATNNIGSHLSHRQNIFTIPVGIDKADIIVFLLNDQFAKPSLAVQKKVAENMKNDKNYIEIFKQGDFIVFEKRNLFLQNEPDITHSRLFPQSIPAMQHRDFAGGTITVEKKIGETRSSSNFIISYLSDGLKIHGLLAIPKRSMPLHGFPVVIVNHGYVNPKTYATEKTYIDIVDFFANRGFLVIKPDYRGNGHSEVDNEALAPLSYSIDVLNLLASLSTLPQANTHNIFLWGHALGGGVTVKTLEVIGENQEFNNMIRAAVVWAPVTDPYAWYQQTRALFPKGSSPYDGIIRVLGTPESNPIIWQSISQLPYTDDIYTPLQIDQGTSDSVISYTSAIELYNDLASLNKTARLVLYAGDNHYLEHNNLRALRSDVQFFRRHLQEE